MAWRSPGRCLALLSLVWGACSAWHLPTGGGRRCRPVGWCAEARPAAVALQGAKQDPLDAAASASVLGLRLYSLPALVAAGADGDAALLAL